MIECNNKILTHDELCIALLSIAPSYIFNSLSLLSHSPILMSRLKVEAIVIIISKSILQNSVSMKKKNELSKQPINLMPYRLKSEDSLDFISNRNPYQAKFIYELLSSPDNSFAEMIKDFRSKGQQHTKIPVGDDFEGPSSIHPEVDKVKAGLAEDNMRLQGEVRSLSIRNEELAAEIEYLRNKIGNMEDGEEHSEHTVRDLQRRLLQEKQKGNPQQKRIQDLLMENQSLQQELSSLKNSLRRLKENRSIVRPSHNSHDSIKDSKEIYEGITLYLRSRVEILLGEMKNIVMSSKLETKLEDFLEEILLINEFTVNKVKKKRVEDSEELELISLPYNEERVRLDKSIEKLKQIQRDMARDDRDTRNRNPSINFLTETKINREPNRSKSARRRIFGNS